MKRYYAEKCGLTAAIADLSPIGEVGVPAPRNSFYINRINTPAAHRGQGYASKVMAQVIADADREGVTLVLEVAPGDTTVDYERLKSWYKRLGFEDKGWYMQRRPSDNSS